MQTICIGDDGNGVCSIYTLHFVWGLSLVSLAFLVIQCWYLPQESHRGIEWFTFTIDQDGFGSCSEWFEREEFNITFLDQLDHQIDCSIYLFGCSFFIFSSSLFVQNLGLCLISVKNEPTSILPLVNIREVRCPLLPHLTCRKLAAWGNSWCSQAKGLIIVVVLVSVSFTVLNANGRPS